MIGLICGIVGFVLTFVYVIFNGIVFTSKYSGVIERDEDGIFAIQSSGAQYTCLNYDKEDYFWGYAKFSDLNKKQYNYKHNFYDRAAQKCEENYDSDYCGGDDLTHTGKFTTSTPSIIHTSCKVIYAKAEVEITNKDKFDRFLTALILSLVVCLANIGLALFGFLLFRTPGDF